MEKFISLLLSGGVSGAIYSLLAIGLVLTYSTSKVFNFGHAATAFASAFIYFQLNSALGWPMPVALVLTVFVFAPLSGYVWDRLVFSRLTGAEEAAGIVAGVGVLIVMPALVKFVVELLRTNFDVPLVDTSGVFVAPGVGPNPPHNWTVTEGFIVSSDQLIVLVVGTIAFVGLSLLLRATPLGLRMRAAVDKPALARLRGTDAEKTSRIAWILSFFLAGVAGVLAAPFPGPFGLNVDNYTFALFVAATAAVIAGLRSIPIAFLGGVLLGGARNLAEGYLTGQYAGAVGRWVDGVYGLRSSLPYWILFVALIVVGVDRKKRLAGTSSEAAPPPDHLADLPRWRRWAPWTVASILLLVYAIGPADQVWRTIVLTGLATGVIFMSFTVVTGLGGMVSLAQSTFVGVAGLTVGLTLSWGWPIAAAALAGVVAAAAIGGLVALPAIRLDGLSLTLVTLALALLGAGVLFNVSSFTNGVDGWQIPRAKFGPLDLGSDETMVVVLFALVVLVAVGVINLQRSASGRAMVALRSSPVGAAASGVPIAMTKLTIFVISASIAGFGGVLLASVNGHVRGLSYPPVLGFTWLAAVVLFGVRRPQGAILAGLMTAASPRLISQGFHVGSFGWDGTTNGAVSQIMFGLGAIGLARHPEGILSQIASRRAARRRATESVPTPAPAAIARERRQDDQKPAAHPSAGGAGDEAPLLEMRDVSAGYGEIEILHDVTLAVRPGQVLALLGANGAGKSTLCNTLAGLVPVSDGRVLFKGEDITSLPVHERARAGVVLVPESRGIFPALTVEENLQLWVPDRRQHAAVYDRFPNLAARRRIHAGNLSGGEQQMLSLAPLIVRPPSILIADEPTLGLAVKVTAEVLQALQVLRDEGTALILVEEKARAVMSIADSVGVLHLGRLQWIDEAMQVSAERIAAAYLGEHRAPPTPLPSEREPDGGPQADTRITTGRKHG